jgi:hypothetical protein
MTQRRRSPRFTLEPLQRLRVVSDVFGQKLDCHLPAQTQVFGRIDHAHATSPSFSRIWWCEMV